MVNWIGLLDFPQEMTLLPLQLSIPPFDRRLRLGFAIDAGRMVGARDTLVSLALHDGAGPLTERRHWDVELGDSDIHRSGNTSIGHYRYLRTVPGKSEIELAFNLPIGVFCSAVAVRKYGEDRAPIEIVAAAYCIE